MQIAPLQTYQGPELDISGNFLKAKHMAQDGALQREEMQMRRDDRADKLEKREKLQGILAQVSEGRMTPEQAAVSALAYDPAISNSLLGIESNRRQGALQQQQMRANEMSMAQQRIKQRQEQIALETRAAKGAITALDGVVEPEQKEKIYGLYMKTLEQQGLSVPDELKGGWNPENEDSLRQLAEMGQMMLDMDPTAMQQDYEFIKRHNPEYADAFLRKEAGIGTEEKTPYSDLAKLTADFKNGFITEDQYKRQSKQAVEGSPEENFEGEDKLRDEYNTLSKDYFDVEKAYNRVQASIEDPSPAGDMALIFNYMKMLDPGSTVREGEYATAQNAASIPEVIRARYNKVMDGKTLSEAQRGDFSQRAKKLSDAAEKSQEPIRKRYSDMAEKYGLDPENIIGKVEISIEDTPQYTAESPAKPTTQEEYDALPSGAYFLDDEGLKVK